MSKRQAKNQLTKDDFEGSDDRDRAEERPELASAAQMASRKIAMPKSRKKDNFSRVNPFQKAQVSSNPFATLANSGSFAPPPAPAQDSSEQDRLLKIRGLNHSFKEAIQAAVEADNLVDLRKATSEYQGYYNDIESPQSNGSPLREQNESDINNNLESQYKSPQAESSDKTRETISSPTFSFGSANQQPIKDKPSSVFGLSTKSENPPIFTFKPPKTDNSLSSPFTFGSSTTSTTKTETPNAPQFVFKAPENKPNFPFESSKPVDQSDKDGESTTPVKPAGNFSWTPERGIKFGSAPSFSFNNPTFGSDSGATSFKSTDVGFTFMPQVKAFPEKDEEDESSDDKESKEEEPKKEELKEDLALAKGEGEEDEETLYAGKTKLNKYVNGSLQLQGVGISKVNLNTKTGKGRIICRTEGSGKIIMNAWISKDLTYRTEKTYIRVPVATKSGIEQWALRIKTQEMANDFLEAIKKVQK